MHGFTCRNTCGPARKTTETTMAAFSDGRRALCAVTRVNDTWQFYRETHSECVYVSTRTFTATMSFVLVYDRTSSFWKTEFHVDSSILRWQWHRERKSVSKDIVTVGKVDIFCPINNLHGFICVQGKHRSMCNNSFSQINQYVYVLQENTRMCPFPSFPNLNEFFN